jgi:hypothetical protein
MTNDVNCGASFGQTGNLSVDQNRRPDSTRHRAKYFAWRQAASLSTSSSVPSSPSELVGLSPDILC